MITTPLTIVTTTNMDSQATSTAALSTSTVLTTMSSPSTVGETENRKTVDDGVGRTICF